MAVGKNDMPEAKPASPIYRDYIKRIMLYIQLVDENFFIDSFCTFKP